MKVTGLAIIIAGIVIGGAIMSRGGDDNTSAKIAGITDNISVVDGTQLIEISAKGGYKPRESTARAGIPTLLRFNTTGTFDCSSAVRIPSMNISRSLPPSGITDVSLGSPQISTLRGTCGMGMYRFEIEFQS